MNNKKFIFALELISNELENSRFKHNASAVLTHFLNSGHMIPDVSDQVYSTIIIFLLEINIFSRDVKVL